MTTGFWRLAVDAVAARPPALAAFTYAASPLSGCGAAGNRLRFDLVSCMQIPPQIAHFELWRCP